MDYKINGKKPTFSNRGPGLNLYRIAILLALIVGGVWVITEIGVAEDDSIQPLFLPTPTPTRTANSYLSEAQAHFAAGKVEDAAEIDAIDAYRKALEMDPENAQGWAELARLLTYSSSLLSTQEGTIARMKEAREAIDTAESIIPDDSTVQAIKALVYDWSASASTDDIQRDEWLLVAEQAASYALNLDPNNYMALAFYAEVLLDQYKLNQALEYAEQAVELQPNAMDTHRVYGTVMENFGQYRVAIEEYERAAEINPNLTFLYIRIGVIYRHLEVYDQALEYFEKAISINNSNGVQDPVPYIGIAKTYSRDGEFFIAALNAEKALAIDPTNPNTYGQLGTIYNKARNYESASAVFNCAVNGCSVEETQSLVDELMPYTPLEITEPVPQLALTNLEVAYFYAQYGSGLAALSRPEDNRCQEALAVLEQVREAFPDDPGLVSIVEENRAICRLISTTPVP